MFNATQGYSLSDIAAVTGSNNNGWGSGDGAWWIILLFLFAGGWGNNGWGGNAGGALTRADLTQDMNFSDISAGIRGIQQGLCDGFYAQNAAITGAAADIQQTLCQGFNGVNTAMLQGFNGIHNQMANDALVVQQCCCETQNLINNKFCELNYNLADQANGTQRAIADSTRDIIDSQNAGTRAILDFLTQDKIASLQSENQTLKFAASQANQNAVIGAMVDASTAEILRRTAPTPVPAYPASALYPYANYGCCEKNVCGNYTNLF